MFKIAVVGAGWYGCHISKSLLNREFNVDLFEKAGVFGGVSSRNQNRLHMGFHYPRSQKTRIQARESFPIFSSTYGFVLQEVQNNFYAVHCQSLVDFETYIGIFAYEGFDFDVVPQNIYPNLSALIRVQERVINPSISKIYFEGQIGHALVRSPFDLAWRSRYDLVIDCTCGQLIPIKEDYYYERFAYLEVSTYEELPSLIVMDGPFFSIFPTANGTFTITHVQKGVLGTSSARDELDNVFCDEEEFIDDVLGAVESDLGSSIREKIRFSKVVYTIKLKPREHTEARVVDLRISDNCVTIIPGKIEAIFEAEQRVLDIVGR